MRLSLSHCLSALRQPVDAGSAACLLGSSHSTRAAGNGMAAMASQQQHPHRQQSHSGRAHQQQQQPTFVQRGFSLPSFGINPSMLSGIPENSPGSGGVVGGSSGSTGASPGEGSGGGVANGSDAQDGSTSISNNNAGAMDDEASFESHYYRAPWASPDTLASELPSQEAGSNTAGRAGGIHRGGGSSSSSKSKNLASSSANAASSSSSKVTQSGPSTTHDEFTEALQSLVSGRQHSSGNSNNPNTLRQSPNSMHVASAGRPVMSGPSSSGDYRPQTYSFHGYPTAGGQSSSSHNAPGSNNTSSNATISPSFLRNQPTSPIPGNLPPLSNLVRHHSGPLPSPWQHESASVLFSENPSISSPLLQSSATLDSLFVDQPHQSHLQQQQQQQQQHHANGPNSNFGRRESYGSSTAASTASRPAYSMAGSHGGHAHSYSFSGFSSTTPTSSNGLTSPSIASHVGQIASLDTGAVAEGSGAESRTGVHSAGAGRRHSPQDEAERGRNASTGKAPPARPSRSRTRRASYSRNISPRGQENRTSTVSPPTQSSTAGGAGASSNSNTATLPFASGYAGAGSSISRYATSVPTYLNGNTGSPWMNAAAQPSTNYSFAAFGHHRRQSDAASHAFAPSSYGDSPLIGTGIPLPEEPVQLDSTLTSGYGYQQTGSPAGEEGDFEREGRT